MSPKTTSTAEKIYCHACSKEVLDDSKFCPNCIDEGICSYCDGQAACYDTSDDPVLLSPCDCGNQMCEHCHLVHVCEDEDETTPTAHTPGPWTTSYHYHDIMANPKGNDLLRVAYTHIAGVPKNELEANAKLIAAAPELLEACVAAYDQECKECYSEGNDAIPREQCLHCVLWDAIAKAKGE